MKRALLLAAAFAAPLLASNSALAQHHGGGHGWGHAAPHFYAPYPIYRSPYYIAPYYPYPYTVFGPPPPTYVERYSIEDAPPQPPQYSYEERSYAQAAPRMERITLSAKELFAFDEAKLHAPQPRLDEIARLMKRHPEIDKVRITGYTDRIGTQSYNNKLSQRRAGAVKSYLVSQGVAAGRLVAVGKGEADPVVQCDDKKMADLIACLEPNRRVEVEEITVERRAR